MAAACAARRACVKVSQTATESGGPRPSARDTRGRRTEPSPPIGPARRGRPPPVPDNRDHNKRGHARAPPVPALPRYRARSLFLPVAGSAAASNRVKKEQVSHCVCGKAGQVNDFFQVLNMHK